MNKLIIAGTRSFNNQTMFNRTIDEWFDMNDPTRENTMILSGMARGPDMMGFHYAIDNEIMCREYHPNWDMYKKSAGFIRNSQMVEDATHLIAFWDGKSNGTHHVIRRAQSKSIPVIQIMYEHKDTEIKTLW